MWFINSYEISYVCISFFVFCCLRIFLFTDTARLGFGSPALVTCTGRAGKRHRDERGRFWACQCGWHCGAEAVPRSSRRSNRSIASMELRRNHFSIIMTKSGNRKFFRKGMPRARLMVGLIFLCVDWLRFVRYGKCLSLTKLIKMPSYTKLIKTPLYFPSSSVGGGDI